MATTGTRVLENLVGGRWVPSTSPDLLDVMEPATGDVLARVPLSTAAELEAAVAAARTALPGWSSVPAIERARLLFGVRSLLASHAEELAASVTREMGKTIGDARAEVARMIEMVEAACAIPTTMQGRGLEDVARGVDCETIRQPVGVCAAIVPFNFPAMVPFWFLPFAIACGNTFVLKPSEQVPLTQRMAFELLLEAGVPDGVVNLVNGGAEVVEAILRSPGVDAISFVGSEKVARLVYTRAAESGKRVQALGGAKNHMVVMPDAEMERTVANVLGSAFGAAGQRCMAGSVVVTVGDARAAFVERLVPAAAGVEMGPLISPAARERIADCVERALAEGASLLLDGRGEGETQGGAWMRPTIVTDVAPDMEIAREEVFGPVLTHLHVDSLSEAIAVVNGSRHGNGASIFTESGAAARRFRHEVDPGMVGINVGVAAPVAFFPFSGWKASFYGDLHAHGLDAVDFFTRKKTVTTRWFSAGETGRYFVE